AKNGSAARRRSHIPVPLPDRRDSGRAAAPAEVSGCRLASGKSSTEEGLSARVRHTDAVKLRKIMAHSFYSPSRRGASIPPIGSGEIEVRMLTVRGPDDMSDGRDT